MVIETKEKAHEAIYALTAEYVMDRNFLIIEKQMLVREAARLLHRKRSHVAAVVDENGRCVGMLRAADVFRWIEAYCPSVVVGAGRTCPYQVQGRLLNGDEAVICTLSHGSCPFQVEQPTTGGRHTDVCVRQESADPPFGVTPCYMATDFAYIKPRTNLTEMVRHLVDTRADGLIVLDEFHRPAGIVSATDVLIAIVDHMCELAKARNEQNGVRKSK